MTVEAMQIGQCGCGATVQRPTMDGWLAALQAEMPFVCETCTDQDERLERADRERSEAQKAAERHARRVERSEVPAALAHVSFVRLNDSGNENAFSGARRWARGDINTLVLTGDVGRGKTTIAAAAINEALLTRSVTWVSAGELLARLGTGFKSEQRDLAIEALLGTSGLVLDDVDKVRPTDYGAEQLFVAIDNCIQRLRPLLVTMNSTLQGVADRYPDFYGEALASRLANFDEGHRVTGPDRRVAP